MLLWPIVQLDRVDIRVHVKRVRREENKIDLCYKLLTKVGNTLNVKMRKKNEQETR